MKPFFGLHAFDFLEPIFDLKHFYLIHDLHGGIEGSNTYLDKFFSSKLLLGFDGKNCILYTQNHVIEMFSVLSLLFHWYVSYFGQKKCLLMDFEIYPNAFRSHSRIHKNTETQAHTGKYEQCTLSI